MRPLLLSPPRDWPIAARWTGAPIKLLPSLLILLGLGLPVAALAAARASGPQRGAAAKAFSPGLSPAPSEILAALRDDTQGVGNMRLSATLQRATGLGLGTRLACYACPPRAPAAGAGRTGLAAIDLRVARYAFDIPLQVTPEVREVLKSFTTGPGRAYFGRYLERGGHIAPLLRRLLARAGLPRDLSYLSMIESGFVLHAYSSAAAVGLWQFMKPTAKDYQLQMDAYVDDRRDPFLATAAAARFLAWLHNRFNDWPLAWAAYNAGPGRVSRTIARQHTRNYWTLCRRHSLPEETCRYVPKILAAALIGHYPEVFGFKSPLQDPDAFAHEQVELRRSVSLADVAAGLGIKPARLARLNPGLRRGITPRSRPGQAPFLLRLPPGSLEKFKTIRDRLPSASLKRARSTHRVGAGDTLWSIARRYHVSVKALKAINHIGDAKRLNPGLRLLIPGAHDQRRLKPVRPTRAKASLHVVVAGDTLWSISRRYSVPLDHLCALNHLSCTHQVGLRIGQVLTLRSAARSTTPPSASPSPQSKPAAPEPPIKTKSHGQAGRPPSSGPSRHQLLPGETLFSLSKRYSVSVESLKALNKIEDPGSLKPGRWILLRTQTGTP